MRVRNAGGSNDVMKCLEICFPFSQFSWKFFLSLKMVDVVVVVAVVVEKQTSVSFQFRT